MLINHLPMHVSHKTYISMCLNKLHNMRKRFMYNVNNDLRILKLISLDIWIIKAIIRVVKKNHKFGVFQNEVQPLFVLKKDRYI